MVEVAITYLPEHRNSLGASPIPWGLLGPHTVPKAEGKEVGVQWLVTDEQCQSVEMSCVPDTHLSLVQWSSAQLPQGALELLPTFESSLSLTRHNQTGRMMASVGLIFHVGIPSRTG